MRKKYAVAHAMHGASSTNFAAYVGFTSMMIHSDVFAATANTVSGQESQKPFKKL